MADSTGTYIIYNKDGYRVVFGAEIENRFHRKMLKSFKDFLLEVPVFLDLQAAVRFANEVEHANKTSRNVVVIDAFKNFNLQDM